MRKGSLHIAVRLLFLAAGLLAAAGVLASCPVDVLPFSAGAGTQVSPCPGVNYAYGRMVYIIRGADIAVTGLPGGTPVVGIGWGFLASYAPQWPATAPLKIYLQNTNDYTNMKSTDWATAVSTMTLVHNATTTIPAGAGVFQIPFTGGASFTYTGGGLYVAFDWGQYTGTPDATVGAMVTTVTSAQTGDTAYAYSNTAPPTTLSGSLERLGTRLLVGPAAPDAGVSAVYSLGSLPINESVGRTFRAYVVNNGNVDFASLPVTLTITGADAFTDTRSVSLPQCGSATVTFTPFTPSAPGACTATVSLPADGNAANDSLSHALDVTPDTCSYKYPGPTPSQGLGSGNSPVEIVAKFNSPAATKVHSAIVEFARASAATYRISVRADDGTGKPGTMLYMDANDRTIGAAGSMTIPLASIVNVGPGNFFVGVVQTNSTNMTLAFDYENPIRPGIFYINRNYSATYTDFSPTLPYKPNLGAILGCPAIALSPATLPSVAMATPYSQTVSASGAPGPYTYAVTTGSLPAGLSLNGTTGVISGTPTASGTFPFTVTATDASTCTGHQDYSITVICPAITVSPASLPGGTAGTAYSQTLTAAGGTSPYTFTVTAGSLPAGLTLNGSTGVLSGTPTASGPFPFTVTATDAIGCTGSQSYTLSVACPAITVSPATLPGGTVGAAYTQTVTAAGGTSPYTFTVTAGSLPTGLALTSGGVLSGTPTASGTFPFTVTATDAHACTGTQSYSVTMVCPAIALSPSALPGGLLGMAYSQTLTAAGGTSPYTYTVTAGSVPAGLTLASGGMLSGTPGATGTFTFTVTATDAHACTGTQSYSVTMTCPAITLSPSALPGGTTQTPYSQTITAAGGTSPYGFAVTAGALPPGLTLSVAGALSGTPTSTGTYTFTVTATDPFGCTGSQAYSVVVVSYYDTFFLDDNGRAKLCVNMTTGAFLWTILQGPYAGNSYRGVCHIASKFGVVTMTTPLGASPRMSLTWNTFASYSTVSARLTDGLVSSTLQDSDTTDNPPGSCS